MKIFVIGSFSFVKEMESASKELERMGHETRLPIDSDLMLADSNLKNTETFEEELKNGLDKDTLRKCFDDVAWCDAVVVINNEKGGIKGYIGASLLMELAVAYYLRKKIFLLNELDKEHKSAPEVYMTKPIILGGDLGRIN